MKRYLYLFTILTFIYACQEDVIPQAETQNCITIEEESVIECVNIKLTEEQIRELLSAVEPLNPVTRSPFFWISSQSDINHFTQMPLCVIMFGADWCGPCKMYTPTFQNVADKCEHDDAYFGFCDVGAHPDIASRFGINSLPATVFFSRGQVVFVICGILGENTLKYYVEFYYPKVSEDYL